MSDDRILEWVEKTSSDFEKNPELPFSSMHLDQLDRTFAWKLGAAHCARLFGGVIRRANSTTVKQVTLILPLEQSAKIVTQAPDLNVLKISDMEPPSLYLLGATFFVPSVSTREEYRVAYDADPWGFTDAHTQVEFVSGRDDASRRNGWEFGNNVWVNRYGPLSADRG